MSGDPTSKQDERRTRGGRDPSPPDHDPAIICDDPGCKFCRARNRKSVKLPDDPRQTRRPRRRRKPQ